MVLHSVVQVKLQGWLGLGGEIVSLDVVVLFGGCSDLPSDGPFGGKGMTEFSKVSFPL